MIGQVAIIGLQVLGAVGCFSCGMQSRDILAKVLGYAFGVFFVGVLACYLIWR